MFDLTTIIEILIAAIAAALTRYAVPVLIEWQGRERLKRLYECAKIAVTAAEQIYGGKTGDKKAEYVRDFLFDRGFTVDVEEVRAALEAAVYELNAAIVENGESAIDE